MKVIGISGSGRKNGYSTKIVKDMLGEITCETEFFSLAGKSINGCRGCLQCTKDNICVQKDDFQEIINKVIEADAVIFAGPNYYGIVNAISVAFWERTFCLRHQEKFLLAGKLAVAVGLDREVNGPALQHIKKMMNSNKMAIVDTFTNVGNYQCFDCTYGHDCKVGNVYPILGKCTPEQAEQNRPKEYSEDITAKKGAKDIGRLLDSILSGRENNEV